MKNGNDITEGDDSGGDDTSSVRSESVGPFQYDKNDEYDVPAIERVIGGPMSHHLSYEAHILQIYHPDNYRYLLLDISSGSFSNETEKDMD